MTGAYVGSELDLFAHAVHWKAYFFSFFEPCDRRVLEVGAGMGATTAILCNGSQVEWLCLEPDPQLLAKIEARIHSAALPACCQARLGTIQDLGPEELFDDILYIDVLEHIEADRAELEQAARHLAVGGRLVVLSPALSFLYSPFDKAIGHFRRYTWAALEKISPPGCTRLKAVYLDSVGLFTSLANRLVLRQSMPTLRQILVWDDKIVPLSRWVDRLTGYRVGRSILVVWERSGSEK